MYLYNKWIYFFYNFDNKYIFIVIVISLQEMCFIDISLQEMCYQPLGPRGIKVKHVTYMDGVECCERC